MDSLGIEKLILSLSVPGIPYGSPKEVEDMARLMAAFIDYTILSELPRLCYAPAVIGHVISLNLCSCEECSALTRCQMHR